ncbi:MAG: hypothetical protein WAU25_10730 [Nitrososphaeraceae archaeon]
MELRDIVGHRDALVRMRTKLKNKAHSIMLMKGMDLSIVTGTSVQREDQKSKTSYT